MHLKAFFGFNVTPLTEGTYMCVYIYDCKQCKRMINSMPISKNKASSQCSVKGAHIHIYTCMHTIKLAESHKFSSPVQFGNDFSMINTISCNMLSVWIAWFCRLLHTEIYRQHLSAVRPKATHTHWEWCPNSGWSFTYTHSTWINANSATIVVDCASHFSTSYDVPYVLCILISICIDQINQSK